MEIRNKGNEEFKKVTQQSDLKQHADKIIRGIKAIGPSHAKRAIWELFQNAVDLSEQCEVLIEINDNELVFSHNGLPFTMTTLDCLITQVSSKTLTEKKRERGDDDQTGQYGTGFMTAHSFGEVVHVSGTIQEVKDSKHHKIPNLRIDRSTQDWKQMCSKIAELREQVGDILTQEPTHEELPLTTFRFEFGSKQNKERATDSIQSLDEILPYVMIFNERLKKVVVKDAVGNETLYEKKEVEEWDNGTYCSRRILINGKAKSLNYLHIDEAIVILPLQAASEDDGYRLIAEPCSDTLPRLFLFYPLIGTESFGFNFVVHSKNFHPTEPRDGLYLQSDNPKNDMEEQTNRAIMDKASDAIFGFLRTNLLKIENPHLLSEIDFAVRHEDGELAQYFVDLKGKWTSVFMTLPLVETSRGRISVQDAVFLDSSVISDVDEATLQAIYGIVSRYYPNLPVLTLVSEWSKIVENWAISSTKWIKFSDIADKISTQGSIDAIDKRELALLYKAMLAKGKGDLFVNKALLPNIKGQFKKLSELRQAIHLPDELTPLADTLNPEISDCRVDPDFIFEGLEFMDFGRQDFREKINVSLQRRSVDKKSLCDLPNDYVSELARYSCIITREDSTSTPQRIIKMIAADEGIEFEPIVISSQSGEDDFDVRTGQTCFLKAYLNDVSDRNENWVEGHIGAFSEILKMAFGYAEFKDILGNREVFPDQTCKLKSISKLSREEEVIPPYIKDMYDDVVKPNHLVRETLAHDSIAEIAQSSKKVLDLTNDIEQRFFGAEGNEISLEGNEFKTYILDVLRRIRTDETCKTLFKATFSHRNALLAQLADGDNAFKIFSQDEQTIRKLAEIANHPNLDELLRLGQEGIDAKKHKEDEMQYKKGLGNHLEDVLRKRLSLSVNATVTDVQNGQDLIIYVEGRPVYYIEVKSKWRKDTTIELSKNQTLKSHRNKTCFALCTIDMTKYVGADRGEVQSIECVVNCMWFNTDVGTKVGHLVDNYDADVRQEDDFRLYGDYRTYIPYWYITQGEDLNAFEEHLSKHIEKNLGGMSVIPKI